MSFDLEIYRDIDFLEKNKIQEVQNLLLKKHIKYCKENSPFYNKLLKDIVIDDVDLTNLKNLPFTEKSDIENNNDELLAVSSNKVVDIVLSSGTTGKPTRIMYTEKDLVRLAYNEEKALLSTGINSSDIVLLTCTIDRCFVAGLAYYLGLKNIGAAVIRNGIGPIESHANLLTRLNPTAIIGVPTFLYKLGLFLSKNGISPERLNVKKLICIGEPVRDKDLDPFFITEELEKLWNAKVYSTYASSEIITAFCECENQNGGHLLPDLAVVEIVDDSNNVLPIGQIGEVVVTPLSIEGMPFVRYKTGDISFLTDTSCSCGRNTPRLGPILGRKKQMMKVQGTTLYPQAIFSVLSEIDFVLDFFMEVYEKSELSDSVKVFVSLKNETLDAMKIIENKLKAGVRTRLDVEIIDNDILVKRVYTSGSRKPVRFFDMR